MIDRRGCVCNGRYGSAQVGTSSILAVVAICLSAGTLIWTVYWSVFVLRRGREAKLTARDGGVVDGEHHSERLFLVHNAGPYTAVHGAAWLAWPPRDAGGHHQRFSGDVEFRPLAASDEDEVRFDQRLFEGAAAPVPCDLLVRWEDGNGQHEAVVLRVSVIVP
jgi:hypothetical protein